MSYHKSPLILLFLLAVCPVISENLFSQSLPENLKFSKDSRQLRLGGVESTGFYKESEVQTIFLDFYDSNFWQQMKDNYNTPDFVLASLTIGNLILDSVGVQFKGQTSYTKPEKNGSEKLSFDVKLDQIIDGQDIEGYNTLNFNNAYQDLSFMKEVLYAHLSREHMPAVKGNYIRLYLNGEDWGIYPNIQQLNGDFLKEWFMNNNGIRWRADKPPWYEQVETVLKSKDEVPPDSNWGDGTAALNYLGDGDSQYQEYYTLKSSEMDDPWNYLIRVCDILNNIPMEGLYDSLRSFLDIDAVIWFLAHEVVFSDDDSYIHKGKMDYYLYQDKETGRMVPLEFDGNSAMNLRNVEWSPFYNFEEENYPLMNRLLNVPKLRQRYIAHVKTILDDCFNEEMAGSLIDGYAFLLASHVQTDPKIDFGYNLYTRGVRNLRMFIEQRKDFILSDQEINLFSPEISNVVQVVEGEEWTSPNAIQEVKISATANYSDGIAGLNLYYGLGLTGNFIQTPMFDDGLHLDGEADDGLFSATIPANPEGTYVRYYIEAVADNEAKTVSYMPEGAEYDVFIYRVSFQESPESGIVINEFLASNNSMGADNYGEYDDWVELFNNSDYAFHLNGYYLTDDAQNLTKWAFPNVTVEPGDYLVLWADDEKEQGSLHTNFKISADGEELFLSDAEGRVLDQVVFQAQGSNISFGRLPNGNGDFITMAPTMGASNQSMVSGLNEHTSEFEFYVYPNPATEQLYIHCNGQLPSNLTVFNAFGQLVFSETFSSMLDISHLIPGIYILRAGVYSTMFQVQ